MIDGRVVLTDGGREVGGLTFEAESRAHAELIAESIRELARQATERMRRMAERSTDEMIREAAREAAATAFGRMGRKTPGHQAATHPSKG